MKKLFFRSLKSLAAFLVSIFIILFYVQHSFGWGFWAHKEINKRAIQLLPSGLQEFFLNHAEFISEHAVDPDKRRSRDSLEQYYHYLDIDYYGKYPFNELPGNYDSAVAKFGAETVLKQGIVPWRIAAYTDSLGSAMRQRNERRILGFAADLGHYVADAHVPLHTVVDYDGVQRGQKGIHKRWESELTERYGQAYRFPTEGAEYIDNPLMYAFATIFESHTYADSVFHAELQALRTAPSAKTVKNIRKNGDTVFVFSNAYYEAFKKFDRGLAERRMQQAILSLASYWYTAWVNAGKPLLAVEEKN